MSKNKHTDANGFVTYEDCQFFCECVAQYLGSEIDPDGNLGLKPKGIYNVYRPKSEIANKEFLATLQAKPILDDHTVIGNVEGMVSPDREHSAGVLTDVRVVGNTLHGRIDLWSPSMIKKVQGGKRELSLAYACDFIARKGVFNGERYDFVQSNLRCGNHLAFVDVARNGHGCRVKDSIFVRDETIKLETPDMDISKLSADEVVEALKGCSDEVRAKCKDFLNTPTEEERKAAEAKAAEDAKKAEEEAKKKAEDEAKAKEEAEKKAKEDAERVAKEKEDACKDAVAEYKDTEKLAADCKPVFGEIAMDGISTKSDLIKHICDMKIDPRETSALNAQSIIKDSKPEVAVATLRGVLAGAGTGVKQTIAKDSRSEGKKSFRDYMATR